MPMAILWLLFPLFFLIYLDLETTVRGNVHGVDKRVPACGAGGGEA